MLTPGNLVLHSPCAWPHHAELFTRQIETNWPPADYLRALDLKRWVADAGRDPRLAVSYGTFQGGRLVTIAVRASPIPNLFQPSHPNPTLLDDKSRHKRRLVGKMGGRSKRADNMSNRNSGVRNNRIPDSRTRRTLTPARRQMREETLRLVGRLLLVGASCHSYYSPG